MAAFPNRPITRLKDLAKAKGLQREIAKAALQVETMQNIPKSFLGEVNLSFPKTPIAGALAETGLGYSTASTLHMLVDLATLWGFGDFDDDFGCSEYYNPESPWYNGFFGGYAMRSYKPDGTAWGYKKDGTVDFEEFFEVCAVDYNFITAGAFGCPPDKMCFQVPTCTTSKSGVWDIADVKAVVPSGLHQPMRFPADPSSYLVFGIPHPAFQNANGDSFAAVKLVGRFYMRRWPKSSQGRPVSFAWGAACSDTDEGNRLLGKIMDAMTPAYVTLGGSGN